MAAVCAVLMVLVVAAAVVGGAAGESRRCCVASEGVPLALACPAGSVVSSLAFVSYGTATGYCGAYLVGACHSNATAEAVLRAQCLGRALCELSVTAEVVGPDPCAGKSKALTVQWTCNGTGHILIADAFARDTHTAGPR
jgi:hypothetical protein